MAFREHSTGLNGVFAPRLLLVAMVCVTATVEAHLPAIYGREFVRWSAPAAKVTPAASAIDADPVNPSPIVSLIDANERSGGAYSEDLAEPLFSLGYYHRQRGDNDAAVEAYLRALQLVRINDGLNSKRQIPILRELLEVYRLEGAHESLDDIYDRYLRVQGMGAPPFTPEWVASSLEYLEWQREAYTRKLDGRARSRLMQAFLVNRNMLQAMAGEENPPLDSYQQLVMSQLANLYLILGDIPVEEEYADFSSGRNHGGQHGSEEYVRQQLRYIQRTGIAAGRDLLQELIARSQQSGPTAKAALHLELGDWYQWNSRLKDAAGEYAEVVRIMRTAGESQLLESWLGEPMELPDEARMWTRPVAEGQDSQGLVVSFDVSRRGYVSHITNGEGQAPDAAGLSRLKRLLRDAHFRPRFSTGQAEAMQHVTRRYLLLD